MGKPLAFIVTVQGEQPRTFPQRKAARDYRNEQRAAGKVAHLKPAEAKAPRTK